MYNTKFYHSLKEHLSVTKKRKLQKKKEKKKQNPRDLNVRLLDIESVTLPQDYQGLDV
jgi:hypothetical protein